MVDRRTQGGFILVVTILVVGVVVGALVMAASASMIGARRGASFERVSFQALRVAENAVDTFADRLISAGYVGAFSQPGIMSWIRDQEDGEDLLIYGDPGGTATIELRVGSRTDSVNVAATATVNGGTKTVVREICRGIGARLNPGALAPLTSLPSVDIRGNATITGQCYLEADGTLPLGAVASDPPPRFDGTSLFLSVPNGVLVRPGFHIDLDGRRYRVEAMAEPITDPAALTLTEAFAPVGAVTLDATYAASLATKVARSVPVPVGISVPSGQVVSNETRVSIPHGRSVRIGSCLRVDLAFAGDDGTYTAEVMSIQDVQVGGGATAEAVLDFTSSTCGGGVAPAKIGIPAGAALVVDVVSVESAANVSAGGHAELTNGVRRYSDWLGDLLDPGDFRPDDLFEEVFGLTKDDFIDLAAHSGRVLSGIAAKDTRYDGITYAPLGADNKSFCGSGFIVIEGDVSFTAGGEALGGGCTGETGFSGIVYITGDFRHQGNSEFEGTVVVQGRAIIDDETTTIGDEETDVRGTGRKVTYDLAAILRAAALVSTPAGPEWVAGTWRQE